MRKTRGKRVNSVNTEDIPALQLVPELVDKRIYEIGKHNPNYVHAGSLYIPKDIVNLVSSVGVSTNISPSISLKDSVFNSQTKIEDENGSSLTVEDPELKRYLERIVRYSKFDPEQAVTTVRGASYEIKNRARAVIGNASSRSKNNVLAWEASIEHKEEDSDSSDGFAEEMTIHRMENKGDVSIKSGPAQKTTLLQKVLGSLRRGKKSVTDRDFSKSNQSDENHETFIVKTNSSKKKKKDEKPEEKKNGLDMSSKIEVTLSLGEKRLLSYLTVPRFKPNSQHIVLPLRVHLFPWMKKNQSTNLKLNGNSPSILATKINGKVEISPMNDQSTENMTGINYSEYNDTLSEEDAEDSVPARRSTPEVSGDGHIRTFDAYSTGVMLDRCLQSNEMIGRGIRTSKSRPEEKLKKHRHFASKRVHNFRPNYSKRKKQPNLINRVCLKSNDRLYSSIFTAEHHEAEDKQYSQKELSKKYNKQVNKKNIPRNVPEPELSGQSANSGESFLKLATPLLGNIDISEAMNAISFASSNSEDTLENFSFSKIPNQIDSIDNSNDKNLVYNSKGYGDRRECSKIHSLRRSESESLIEDSSDFEVKEEKKAYPTYDLYNYKINKSDLYKLCKKACNNRKVTFNQNEFSEDKHNSDDLSFLNGEEFSYTPSSSSTSFFISENNSNKEFADSFLSRNKHIYYNSKYPAFKKSTLQKQYKISGQLSKYEPCLRDSSNCHKKIKETQNGNRTKNFNDSGNRHLSRSPSPKKCQNREAGKSDKHSYLYVPFKSVVKRQAFQQTAGTPGAYDTSRLSKSYICLHSEMSVPLETVQKQTQTRNGKFLPSEGTCTSRNEQFSAADEIGQFRKENTFGKTVDYAKPRINSNLKESTTQTFSAHCMELNNQVASKFSKPHPITGNEKNRVIPTQNNMNASFYNKDSNLKGSTNCNPSHTFPRINNLKEKSQTLQYKCPMSQLKFLVTNETQTLRKELSSKERNSKPSFSTSQFNSNNKGQRIISCSSVDHIKFPTVYLVESAERTKLLYDPESEKISTEKLKNQPNQRSFIPINEQEGDKDDTINQKSQSEDSSKANIYMTLDQEKNDVPLKVASKQTSGETSNTQVIKQEKHHSPSFTVGNDEKNTSVDSSDLIPLNSDKECQTNITSPNNLQKHCPQGILKNSINLDFLQNSNSYTSDAFPHLNLPSHESFDKLIEINRSLRLDSSNLNEGKDNQLSSLPSQHFRQYYGDDHEIAKYKNRKESCVDVNSNYASTPEENRKINWMNCHNKYGNEILGLSRSDQLPSSSMNSEDQKLLLNKLKHPTEPATSQVRFGNSKEDKTLNKLQNEISKNDSTEQAKPTISSYNLPQLNKLTCSEKDHPNICSSADNIDYSKNKLIPVHLQLEIQRQKKEIQFTCPSQSECSRETEEPYAHPRSTVLNHQDNSSSFDKKSSPQFLYDKNSVTPIAKELTKQIIMQASELTDESDSNIKETTYQNSRRSRTSNKSRKSSISIEKLNDDELPSELVNDQNIFRSRSSNRSHKSTITIEKLNDDKLPSQLLNDQNAHHSRTSNKSRKSTTTIEKLNDDKLPSQLLNDQNAHHSRTSNKSRKSHKSTTTTEKLNDDKLPSQLLNYHNAHHSRTSNKSRKSHKSTTTIEKLNDDKLPSQLLNDQNAHHSRTSNKSRKSHKSTTTIEKLNDDKIPSQLLNDQNAHHSRTSNKSHKSTITFEKLTDDKLPSQLLDDKNMHLSRSSNKLHTSTTTIATLNDEELPSELVNDQDVLLSRTSSKSHKSHKSTITIEKLNDDELPSQLLDDQNILLSRSSNKPRKSTITFATLNDEELPSELVNDQDVLLSRSLNKSHKSIITIEKLNDEEELPSEFEHDQNVHLSRSSNKSHKSIITIEKLNDEEELPYEFVHDQNGHLSRRSNRSHKSTTTIEKLKEDKFPSELLSDEDVPLSQSSDKPSKSTITIRRLSSSTQQLTHGKEGVYVTVNVRNECPEHKGNCVEAKKCKISSAAVQDVQINPKDQHRCICEICNHCIRNIQRDLCNSTSNKTQHTPIPNCMEKAEITCKENVQFRCCPCPDQFCVDNNPCQNFFQQPLASRSILQHHPSHPYQEHNIHQSNEWPHIYNARGQTNTADLRVRTLGEYGSAYTPGLHNSGTAQNPDSNHTIPRQSEQNLSPMYNLEESNGQKLKQKDQMSTSLLSQTSRNSHKASQRATVPVISENGIHFKSNQINSEFNQNRNGPLHHSQDAPLPKHNSQERNSEGFIESDLLKTHSRRATDRNSLMFNAHDRHSVSQPKQTSISSPYGHRISSTARRSTKTKSIGSLANKTENPECTMTKEEYKTHCKECCRKYLKRDSHKVNKHDMYKGRINQQSNLVSRHLDSANPKIRQYKCLCVKHLNQKQSRRSSMNREPSVNNDDMPRPVSILKHSLTLKKCNNPDFTCN